MFASLRHNTLICSYDKKGKIDSANAGEHDMRRLTLRPRPEPLPHRLSEQEIAAHAELVARLGDKAIWSSGTQKGG